MGNTPAARRGNEMESGERLCLVIGCIMGCDIRALEDDAEDAVMAQVMC